MTTVFILVYLYHGLLLNATFNTHDECLEFSKQFSQSYCIEAPKDGLFGKNFSDLTK